MKPYSGQIEMTLGIAEFKRLADACDATRDAVDAAFVEYQWKESVPIIGLFYSMPAWKRYRRAYAAYNEAFARFMAFTSIHLARLQGMPCMPARETIQ